MCRDCLAKDEKSNAPAVAPTPEPVMEPGITPATDSIVERNVDALRARAAAGFIKYGTTLERQDLTLRDWLQHALEEVLDQANYLQAAIQKIDADKES